MDILQVLVQLGGAPTVPALHLHAGVVAPPPVHERELATLVLDWTHVIGLTPAVRIPRGCGAKELFCDCFWIIINTSLSCGLLGTDILLVTATVSSLRTAVIAPAIFVRSSSASSLAAAGIHATIRLRRIYGLDGFLLNGSMKKKQ